MMLLLKGFCLQQHVLFSFIECECNGHLLSCDNEGKCLCNAQGVTGSQCDT